MESEYHNIEFYSDIIQTTVTVDPNVVSNWISETEFNYRHQIYLLNTLVVGFDVEWHWRQYNNSRNPVATLQLCVGRRCLIYQLIHTTGIPTSLAGFLSNRNYTFVGLGIGSDLDKLEQDYGLGGRNNTNAVDLGVLAAEQSGRRELKNVGLKQLGILVLGKEMEKSSHVTMSRWDYRWLSPDQVKYACIDAFVSYEIGRVLHFC